MAHSVQVIGTTSQVFNDLDLIALLCLMLDEVRRHPEEFSTIAPTRSGWDDAKVAVVRSDTIAPVRARCEGLRPRQGGTLSKAWNAHPAGSIVLAESADLSEGFAIVDLPD